MYCEPFVVFNTSGAQSIILITRHAPSKTDFFTVNFKDSQSKEAGKQTGVTLIGI